MTRTDARATQAQRVVGPVLACVRCACAGAGQRWGWRSGRGRGEEGRGGRVASA